MPNLTAELISSFDNTFDINKWANNNGIELESNQIETIDTFCRASTRYLVLLGARGSGKTHSVSMATIRLCIENSNYVVLVFGPKAEQAVRLLSEISKICKLSSLKKYIDWKTTSKSRINFINGSYVISLSASMESEQEGPHGNLIICDEAQNIPSQSFSSRISPMMSGMVNPKMVKLGICSSKGHFYHSFNDKKYVKLVYPWDKCPRLFKGGVVNIGGKLYPQLVLERMPLSYKKELFPDNPEYHEPGDMDEIDFDTQYGMKWRDDLNNVLSEEDQLKLIGEHEILHQGQSNITYYFGLDCAGGGDTPEGKQNDSTVLSIWELEYTGIKKRIFTLSMQGNSIDQIQQIIEIIHPKHGLFKCKFGLADYGNMGSVFVDAFKKEGIPVEGIKFGALHPNGIGKNWKNVLYDHFVYELQSNRVKYPSLEVLNRDSLWKDHYNQWCLVQRKKTNTPNDKISSPDKDTHDDSCSSDILGIFAIDKENEIKKTQSATSYSYKFPSLVFGGSIANKGNDNNKTNQIPGFSYNKGHRKSMFPKI